MCTSISRSKYSYELHCLPYSKECAARTAHLCLFAALGRRLSSRVEEPWHIENILSVIVTVIATRDHSYGLH